MTSFMASCCSHADDVEEYELKHSEKRQKHRGSTPADGWDCIVVGAGIVGSSTTYHLSRNGMRTLMLDQFFLPHTRGGSHGQSSVIRQAYHKHLYAALVPEAFSLWRQFERESGRQLFRETGMLMLADKNSSVLRETVTAMDRYELPYEMLTADEVQSRFPMLNYDMRQLSALYDTSAGVLIPDRCLSVIQDLALDFGATINDGEPVIDIVPETYNVKVVTDIRTYITNQLILTPGPWANDLLHKLGLHLPLETIPGHHCYWKINKPDDFASLPIVFHETGPTKNETNRRFIIFPSIEYPGLIKTVTQGDDDGKSCHPNMRDKQRIPHQIPILSNYIKQHLPGLHTTPALLEPGIYSNTPDKDYIVDVHPKYSNIFIGVGLSGHGYKLAPVLGKLLWQMAAGRRLSYDIHDFALRRFPNSCLIKK